MQECFIKEFGKVCAYESYAVLRNPRERFISALFHHLREVHHIQVSHGSLGWLPREARDICDRLRLPVN